MQQTLRIGFVSVQDATDIHTWSGLPANMLQELRKLNIQVEVYSPLSQQLKHLLLPFAIWAKIFHTKMPLDRFQLLLNSYARQIKRLIRERPVDVIFSTSSIPITTLDCSQPIVFWTDAVFHSMLDYYKGGFSHMSPTSIERGKVQEQTALNRCTFAVYASIWAASHASQLASPSKIHVIPFGASFAIPHTLADVRLWVRDKQMQRSSAGRTQTCHLLFIGVDWVRKGGAIAVEVARLLNEAGIATKLTVVGCRPEEATPEFVNVLGFISKSTSDGKTQLQTLLRQADFFILPSLAEAAGIVFCEASAFGLPSLSYATGGVPDYVRNGVNGVCLPVGTPASEFATAIQEILENPGQYEALCLGAYNEYQTRLNWQTSIRALVDLCQRALQDSQCPEQRTVHQEY